MQRITIYIGSMVCIGDERASTRFLVLRCITRAEEGGREGAGDERTERGQTRADDSDVGFNGGPDGGAIVVTCMAFPLIRSSSEIGETKGRKRRYG